MIKRLNITFFWGLFGTVLFSLLGFSTGNPTADLIVAFGGLQFMHFIPMASGVLGEGNLGDDDSVVDKLIGKVKDWFEEQKGSLVQQSDLEAKMKELTEIINGGLKEIKNFKPDNSELEAKLKELGDVIDKQGLVIKALEESGKKPQDRPKTLEEHITEVLTSEQVKELLSPDSKISSVRQELDVNLKTVSRSGVMPLGGYDPQVQEVLQPRLPISHIRQVISTSPTKIATITYLRIRFTSNAIAFVAENGKLPESAFETVTDRVDTKRIGTHIKVSDNALKEDPEGVVSDVYAMITDDVMSKEDHAVLFGDGSSNNHIGISQNAVDFATIINNGHRFYQKVENANEIDVLVVALSILRNTRFRPTAIVLNVDDATALTMQKSEVGDYLVRAKRVKGILFIDDIPVVELPGDIMASGDFLLGNFVQGVAIRDYTNLAIQIIKTEDDDLKNQSTIKAEFQAALPIKYANGFVKGKFSTAQAAISKPKP